MCLIAVYPPGVPVDMEALEAGSRVNDDGHGFTVWTPTGFITHKGMKRESMLRIFHMIRDSFPEYPAIWHSRWVTSGPLSEENIHPFPMLIDGQPAMLAHNGTLSDIPADETHSDTRIFIEKYMPGILNEETCAALNAYLSAHESVMVVLKADGTVVYLGAWDDDYIQNGVHYSNADYVPPSPVPDNVDAQELVRRLYRRLCEVQLRAGFDDPDVELLATSRAALLELLPDIVSGTQRKEQ